LERTWPGGAQISLGARAQEAVLLSAFFSSFFFLPAQEGKQLVFTVAAEIKRIHAIYVVGTIT